MTRVGFIGWRGMVGSVLMERMQVERDFEGLEPHFFSTSQVGQPGPQLGFDVPVLADALDLKSLAEMDVLVSCQGGSYTNEIFAKLRAAGWKGYWIDAASALRLVDDSVIVLDPVNRGVIDAGLSGGIKTFVGGNCTVSLMLMALAGLFERNCIEWISSMTYQAASGAGANNMRELVTQMAALAKIGEQKALDSSASILDLDRAIGTALQQGQVPMDQFGAPLAGSLIPWIDKAVQDGQTREEWKGAAETNKILRAEPPIPVDGICVRIGAMRSHSQGLTIKLKSDIPLGELTDMIGSAHEWVRVVPNEKEATLQYLSPAAVSGTLDVAVGRIRKMNIGPEYLTLFTVGDQLLWGAAEPLRRMLRIVLEHVG